MIDSRKKWHIPQSKHLYDKSFPYQHVAPSANPSLFFWIDATFANRWYVGVGLREPFLSEFDLVDEIKVMALFSIDFEEDAQ